MVFLAALSQLTRAAEPASPPRTEIEKTIQAKMAEVELLQREIADLQRQLVSPTQLLVHLRQIEIDLDRAAALGFDVDAHLEAVKRFDKLTGEERAKWLNSIEDLIAKQAATVLMAPTMTTVMGRESWYTEGADVPGPVAKDGTSQTQFAGTKIRLLGTRMAQKRVKLEISAEVSAVDEEHPLKDTDGKTYPRLSMTAVQTTVSLAERDAAIFGEMLTNRTSTKIDEKAGQENKQTQRTHMLFIARVETVDPPHEALWKGTTLPPAQQPPQIGWSKPGGTTLPGVSPTPYGADPQQGYPAVPNADARRAIIEMSMRVYEVSITKLRELGHDVKDEDQVYQLLGMTKHLEGKVFASPANVHVATPHALEDDGALVERLEHFVKAGAVSLQSRPQAITLDGQEATVSVGERIGGGQAETPEDAPLGLGLAFKSTPKLQPDGSLTLEIDATHHHLRKPPQGPTARDARPWLGVRQVQTSLNIQPGQTAVLHCSMFDCVQSKRVNEQTNWEHVTVMPLILVQAKVRDAAREPAPASGPTVIRPSKYE